MMLKKSIHILISILLLLATTGISISAHYCGEKLRAVSLMNTPAGCCDDASCCLNETQFYQLDDDFTFLYTEIKFLSDQQVIHYPRPDEAMPVAEKSNSPLYNDIPLHPRIRSYLALIQSFLL
ncbi:MAG: hypothetical protein RQ761_12120 [Bacteroidales bacterium]|nr:hypothetical protein [Bacteroidales bacterium]